VINKNIVFSPNASQFARRLILLTLALITLAGGTAAPPASARPLDTSDAVVLPPGFVSEPYVTGLRAPRAFAWTPDGRMLILERGADGSADINFASLRVFKNGALLPDRALTLNVCGDGERGALGIAVDPDFANNQYIYIYYTRQTNAPPPAITCEYGTYSAQPDARLGPRNRISRFTMSGDVVAGNSERVIIDGIASDVGVHNAGDLHFDADGYLYASTGDGGINTLSQPSNTLNGKILRLKPDNSIRGYSTAGNPFDAVAGARYCSNALPSSDPAPCREVYALGLRNPFRFTRNTASGQFFIGDVGGGSWEEINILAPGANYGYPQVEGFCNCSTYTEPVYSYAHVVQNANVDSAIAAIGYYSSTAYPVTYTNSIFFADVVQGWMRRMYFNSGNASWAAEDFMSGETGIIGIRQGPDENLYYMVFTDDNGTANSIKRIRHTARANRAPTAAIAASSLFPALNASVAYSGAASYDPDGDTLIYRWNLAGGGVISSTSASVISQSYAIAGPKVVTLTVIDTGAPPLSSAPVSITVFAGWTPPTASIVVTNTMQPTRSLFHGGDTWQYGASNPSTTNGLAANPYTWAVVFHHRDHAHPFLSGVSGSGGQFTLPRSGETDTAIWYRIELRITDAQGATNMVWRDIHPMTTTIGLATAPSGGIISVNGHTYLTPASIARVIGMQDELAGADQLINNTAHRFWRWSTGAPRVHMHTARVGPETLTATLLLPSTVRDYYFPIVSRR
jgi:glucose/arabinose dehydrogenase